MAKPVWIHLTATTTLGMPTLTHAEVGAWLWQHMRDAFALAIAALLMPDHVHVLLASVAPELDRQRLARLLGQLARRFGVLGRAAIVPRPETIRGGIVLERSVRYIALNPCREELVRCPLAWMWSTHRDVVGAAVDPWVSATRLADALGRSAEGFGERHHAYVSGDPHAHVSGTPYPQPAAPTLLPHHGLRVVAEAATSAFRQPVAAIRSSAEARALFVALAYEQGWGHAAKLAEVCGCSPKTIRRHASAVDAAAMPAARLCMGDERLRRWWAPTSLAEDVRGRGKHRQ
ncbi:MAG TPA: hypothetical protein VG755_21060 [Nannocystaceae bacterium]|nr:hypothetical protein [Nannocystaceae bacterium]